MEEPNFLCDRLPRAACSDQQTKTSSLDERRRLGLDRPSLNVINPLWLLERKPSMNKTRFVPCQTSLSIGILALASLCVGLSPAFAGTAKGVALSSAAADPASGFLAIQVGADGTVNMGTNPTNTDCG